MSTNKELVNNLKRSRALLKSKFTRFINFLNDDTQHHDSTEIEARLEQARNCLSEFETIQNEIDDKTGIEENELQAFENLYYKEISRVVRLIKTYKTGALSATSGGQASDDETNGQTSTASMRLPKIELITFDGSYEKWTEFHDSFNSMINQNKKLANVDKLHYLRSCLKGEAASTIESLATTEQNFNVAWELLNKQFDNKRLIIQSHTRSLLELRIINRESADDLRELINKVRTHLRALENLEEPVKYGDTIIIQIIMQKLDRRTLRDWENTLSDSNMPNLDELLTFLDKKRRILQITVPTGNTRNNTQKGNNSAHSTRKSFASTQNVSSCILCKNNHKLFSCKEFMNMTVQDRVDTCKKHKLCFNCLNNTHRNDQCKWQGCKKCSKKHNTLLHYEKIDNNSVNNNNGNTTTDNTSASSTTRVMSAMIATEVLLSTAVVDFEDKDGKRIRARVILDTGSQSNFVSERFANTLKIAHKKIDLPVEGLNKMLTKIKKSINATVYSRVSNYKTALEFLVLPRICDDLPSQLVNIRNVKIPGNIKLADPEFNKPSEVDALLGAELFYELLCVGQISLSDCNLTATKTKLGWIVSGKLKNEVNQGAKKCHVATIDAINRQIAQFWEIEEMPDGNFLSEEEAEVEKFYSDTTRRDPRSGRYVVRLPFNKNINKLGNSYLTAHRRFLALERKMNKNKELSEYYHSFMREYIDLKHMTELTDDDKMTGYYMPHHTVVKESSETTKVRVVFDASAKTDTGLSLNNCLKVGPTIQQKLFNILLRFRTHQYVMTADIEKMYRQVLVNERDAEFQKILYRERREDIVKVYRANTVTYVTAAAPFLAVRSLFRLANDTCATIPRASEIIKRDFYVDDLLTGADSIDDAIQIRDELIKIMERAGFTLRKWASNEVKVIQSIVQKSNDVNLFTINEIQGILGVQWNSTSDIITYKVAGINENRVTKRSILSNIAKLFDPIGLLGPVIVSAKLMMQRVWQCCCNWDESISLDIYTSWTTLKNELYLLNNSEFSRKVIIKDAKVIELHGFCDASEKAYGACIYVRSINNQNKVFTNLLCAKSRVAPLKTLSIPRLELCGALLLSELLKIVLESLCKKIDSIHLWCDSSITLQWIQTQPHTLKTFVANRVSEIRKSTNVTAWKHVPSQDNPADCLSRGQLPSELMTNKNWKVGPDWLNRGEDQWPKQNVIRVPIVSGPLTAKELHNALICILRLTQQETYKKEIISLKGKKNVAVVSDLVALNPFIDKDGLIRVGGRLMNAEVPYSMKHPIVLPKNHGVTNLIIEQIHTQNLHSGIQATLCSIREDYWPISGKKLIKNCIKNCWTCARVKPREYNYIMGNLPRDRVVQSRPFLSTGVDYCGPFFIKEKRERNRNKVKVYVAIFICLSTKACHLEVVSDLTTDAFIASLRRFFARRGKSINMYSDNATNFVGANRELKSLTNLVTDKKFHTEIFNHLAKKNINWHFSPPRSPHFGGLWEAAVRSFKHHFYRTIGERLFTYEELNTYVIEIEAILNSRPITPLSSDPNDLNALSPSHFLIGETLYTIPHIDLNDINPNKLSTWQHIQAMKKHFWSRWTREYLNQLTIRSKWRVNHPETVKIGTMVVIKEKNLPPLRWQLGRITKIHPGSDGVIRTATVKTSSGEYLRSLKELAPLSCTGEY